MGEWLTLPGADAMIAERANHFLTLGYGGRYWRRRTRTSRCSDLAVLVGGKECDVANLADLEGLVSPHNWEDEIPLTDDGF